MSLQRYVVIQSLSAALLIAALLVPGAGLGAPVVAGAVTDTGFVCSAGTQDGAVCASDTECPDGVCVLLQGVCDGGGDDGFPCDCPGGQCTNGTCAGGVFDSKSCDVANNCAGGVACVGSQRVCLAGDVKGFSCLRASQCTGTCSAGTLDGAACGGDAECPGGVCVFFECVSTGKACVTGDFQDYSCVDDADCSNASVLVGSCSSLIACTGDCGSDGSVTVDEIVRGVNIALGIAQLDQCQNADRDGDGNVTVDELVAAVNNALQGCP